ncbi:MAG: FprA family A-type flavoprotein [Magnetospiraceae bacterium]
MISVGDGAVSIGNEVYWAGAFDPDLRNFDIILRTANGTSYNAYLIRGEDGVAIVDTVKQEFADTFFKRLESVARYDEIKVIVLNHLEPDHTGALPELMRRAPQAQVFISRRAPNMLKALLKPDLQEFPFTAVATGDSVSIGGRTLRFLNTPYLHWPDTQCTYLEEDKILFSGDVFGCHFCDDRLFNDMAGDFRFSFEYYYSHIMRPFKEYVNQALDLIEPLSPALVAPAHGPILRDRPRDYIRRYRELSRPSLKSEVGAAEKSLLIFYISAYGSTATMAQSVRRGAEQIPGVRVSLYDLAGGDPQPFVDLVEEADGLIFGSPTINGDAAKPVWDLLSSLGMIKTQGKLGAAFGSYGWTGEAVDMIEARLRGLKMRVPVSGMRLKLAPSQAELGECERFGRAVAEHLCGLLKPREIDLASLG